MDSLDKINSLIKYFTNLQNIVKSDEKLSKIIIDYITTIISHIKVIDEESNEIPDNIKLNLLIYTEQSDNDSDSEFNDKLVAGIPKDVKVAHKYGLVDEIL